MNFQAYEKMPQSLKKLNLEGNPISILDKVDWVVTEKVHGANFSFIYEDKALAFGKRKAELHWEDDFFGFQLVVTSLEENILELFEALSLDIPAAKYTIYGELFGGEYPHPEVSSNPNLQAIQTGIYYSPNIQFCAFDIAIETAEDRYYLDYEKAIQYFETFKIFHAKALWIGALNQALVYNIEFDSTIPHFLELPKLDNNLVEGIVIKPYHNLPIEEGKPYIRPILKIKNEQFSEEKKFHQAEKWSFIPDTTTNSEHLNFLLVDLRNYVTNNRLNNVLSKIGKLDFSNKERLNEIRNNYIEDVFQDFNENNDTILEMLQQEQIDWLKKRLLVDINTLIQSV